MTGEGRSEADEKKIIRVRIDGKRLLLLLAVIIIILGGAALRVHSLAASPYPYILDGLGEANYARHIAMTGSLAPDPEAGYASTHTVFTPAYDALIALTSLFQGEQPLFLIQKLIAPFGAMLLLGAYAMARKFSGSSRVGLFALMALSAYGPFLIVTQATWKECIGLSMLPFIYLSFAMRRDRRMRALSTFLLLFIPFVHHAIALIAILTIAFVSSSTFLLARKGKRLAINNIIDVLVAIIAADELILYYSIVKLDRLEYLTPENGLYLFIGLAILMAVGIYYISDKGLSAIGRRALFLVTSLGMILLVAMNLVAPIGTIESSALFAVSLPLIVCVVLVLMGIMGISIWAATVSESKTFFFAVLASPFVLVIYGLLRAEDILSLDIITRSIDLLDLGVMIGLGTFLVYFLRNRSKARTYAIASAVCVLLLLSLPFAIDSEHYAGTRNDINSFEIEAINWTVSMNPGANIQTDTQYSYVVRYLFNDLNDQTLVHRLIGKLDMTNGAVMIASERWVTIGVKDLPYGWIKIDPGAFTEKLQESNLLYIGGPSDMQIIVFSSAQ